MHACSAPWELNKQEELTGCAGLWMFVLVTKNGNILVGGSGSAHLPYHTNV